MHLACYSLSCAPVVRSQTTWARQTLGAARLEAASWELNRIVEYGPNFARQVPHRLRIARCIGAFAGNVADDHCNDAAAMLAGEFAIDFRVLLTGVSDQHKAPLWKVAQK